MLRERSYSQKTACYAISLHRYLEKLINREWFRSDLKMWKWWKVTPSEQKSILNPLEFSRAIFNRVMRLESRASGMLGNCSTTKLYLQVWIHNEWVNYTKIKQLSLDMIMEQLSWQHSGAGGRKSKSSLSATQLIWKASWASWNLALPSASVPLGKAAIDRKVNGNETNRQDSLEHCLSWLISESNPFMLVCGGLVVLKSYEQTALPKLY